LSTDSLFPRERASFRVSGPTRVKWFSQPTYFHTIPIINSLQHCPALQNLLINSIDLFAMSDSNSNTEIGEVKVTEASNSNSSFFHLLTTPLLSTARVSRSQRHPLQMYKRLQNSAMQMQQERSWLLHGVHLYQLRQSSRRACYILRQRRRSSKPLFPYAFEEAEEAPRHPRNGRCCGSASLQPPRYIPRFSTHCAAKRWPFPLRRHRRESIQVGQEMDGSGLDNRGERCYDEETVPNGARGESSLVVLFFLSWQLARV